MEAGGCGSSFSSKLCWIPYPKYMANPRREMRQWEGKVGAFPNYKCPTVLLSWHQRQFGGVQFGFNHSLSQKVTYQSPSRYQTGPSLQRSSASSYKCSERCSPVGGQAEQGPMGRVSSSLNTPQTSERETLPHGCGKTPVLLRLCIQCLLRLCM